MKVRKRERGRDNVGLELLAKALHQLDMTHLCFVEEEVGDLIFAIRPRRALKGKEVVNRRRLRGLVDGLRELGFHENRK